ncbi:MAG TPA: hypothetical protein VES42_08680, partial [Pilimelia sp.]|nr:hypothetical protein [Pilimelia sp.]
MLKWRRPAGMVSAGLVLLAGACTRATPDGEPAPPSPVRPAWSAVALPAPAGPAGRLVLRDLVACGGRWYAVGGVAGADGTRPAAWASADARTWTSLPTLPSTYYGERNILYAAGCRDGRLTPLGAKSGGAHGNPRVSSWRQRPDGALVEVRAHFELFGGPQAVNVFRITGGPAGWLIGGNRMSGAAVWVSPDAAAFRIVEREPRLATDPRGETWAFDVVPAPGGGWLLSGSLLRPGRTDRDPLMWSSPDGSRWSRVAVPATPEHEELRRVATVGG